MLAVLAWTLRVVLALVILGWLATALRVWKRSREARWVLRPDSPACDPGVRVSVVIPARNEEANIGPCLDAALAQDHPNLQVVVLDDGSTDGTPRVLDAYRDRVQVLQGEGGPLPEGWFGKPWALQRAQEQADGDWLFFIDADVRLAPQAVSRVVAYGQEHGLGMVTGFGTLTMETFWEKVLQPAVAGVILMGNDLDEVNDPDKSERNMASGQLLAFSRAGYDAAGRHEAVKDDILDDVGLARACVANEVPYRCLVLRELYSVRMYTSLAEIWEGWSKNLFAGLHYSWGVTLAVLVYLFTVTLLGPVVLALAAVGVLGPEWLVWGGAQVVVMQAVRAWLDHIWGHRMLYGLSHAPATAMVMAIMVHSGIKSQRGSVTWKGRSYKPS